MRKLYILGMVIVLILSLSVNAFFFHSYIETSQLAKNEADFEENIQKYPLLSVRILSKYHSDYLLNFLDLRNKLHAMLDPLGKNFEMYFEYLPTGTSIGINSGDNFFAASLFKLPVVMAYYRHKERVNLPDNASIKLTQDMLDDRFGDLWLKGVGYEIRYEDAARIAIENSDNTAAKALGPVIEQQDFDNVYQGLDVDLNLASQGAVMTPKNYSSILKALYFSAVLSRTDSQKILAFMKESKFTDKLVAGVPSGVRVAHKIGVIDDKSYMDCGIVYAPQRPYVLCMVSIGTENDARMRMKNVSKTIYDYVSNLKSLDVDD